VVFAEGDGGAVGDLLEGSGELFGAGEAAELGDAFEGEVGVDEHAFGLFDALSSDFGVDGPAEVFLESSFEGSS